MTFLQPYILWALPLMLVPVSVRAAMSNAIAQAVLDLGAVDYERREWASRFLSDLGDEAKPFLKEAAEHSDPEVSTRARSILKWRERQAEAAMEKIIGLHGEPLLPNRNEYVRLGNGYIRIGAAPPPRPPPPPETPEHFAQSTNVFSANLTSRDEFPNMHASSSNLFPRPAFLSTKPQPDNKSP